MEKAKRLSEHQLFNIARGIAGITLKNYCQSFVPPVSPATVIACLDGRWKNRKIEKSILGFIGTNLSELAFFFIDKPVLLKQKRFINKP